MSVVHVPAHRMSPFYYCDDGHDEVRWAYVAGRACFHCGREGLPARGITITSTMFTPDHVYADRNGDTVAVRI